MPLIEAAGEFIWPHFYNYTVHPTHISCNIGFGKVGVLIYIHVHLIISLTQQPVYIVHASLQLIGLIYIYIDNTRTYILSTCLNI